MARAKIVRVELRFGAPDWASTSRAGVRYVRSIRDARMVRESHPSWLGMAIDVIRADGSRNVEVV